MKKVIVLVAVVLTLAACDPHTGGHPAHRPTQSAALKGGEA